MNTVKNEYVESMIKPVFSCAGIGIELAPWEVLADGSTQSAERTKEAHEVELGKNLGGKFVFLTYFKQSGKYYSSGCYETEKIALYQIWEEVAQMQIDGKLPGLMSVGGGDRTFDVLIEVPGHPHEHPRLNRAVEKD